MERHILNGKTLAISFKDINKCKNGGSDHWLSQKLFLAELERSYHTLFYRACEGIGLNHFWMDFWITFLIRIMVGYVVSSI
jgi:hypothetical protein